MGFFAFAVVIAQIAAGVAHLPEQFRSSACALVDGSMPNWKDDTCSTYLQCEDLVLTTKTCPEGQAYLLKEDACVAEALVDCDKQNKLVNATLMTSALLAGYSHSDDDDDEGHGGDDVDDDDDDDDNENDPPEGMANIASALRRLIEHKNRRVKRHTTEAVGSSTSDYGMDVVPLALPEVVCERLDNETGLLESLLNTVLLSETDCLANWCNLPLFQLSCDPQEEEEEKIDQTEAERESQENDDSGSDEEEGGIWNPDQETLQWLAKNPKLLRGKINS